MKLRSLLSPFVYPKEALLGEQFNFGNRETIFAANGIPGEYIFSASLQHGWVWSRKQPPVKNKSFREYPIMVWSERIALEMASRGVANVHVAGSPWAHLLKACRIDPMTQAKGIGIKRKRKLLFFPNHSSPDAMATVKCDISRISADLGDVDITVCLFWLDFVDPTNRQHFLDLGCEVVCVGSRGSAALDTPWSPVGGRVLFTPRLLELIIKSDIIGVESVISPLWYALSLGKSVYIQQSNEEYRVWKKNETYVEKLNYDILRKQFEIDLPLFSFREEIVCTRFLQEIALKEVGWDAACDFNRETAVNFLARTKLDPELISPITEFIRNWNTQH